MLMSLALYYDKVTPKFVMREKEQMSADALFVLIWQRRVWLPL